MRVLVTDDSGTMRRIIITQIKSMGISDIIEASNGEEALSLLEANMPVNLLVLDINMPVLDGMAVLRKIRSDSRFNDMRIVMVTSESEKTKVIEAIGAGANDYLVKPFTPENFNKKMGFI